MQRLEAPPQIARAIQALDRSGRVDVILIVRGGGSIEDLWAFNDERVVRAAADCFTATVAGVGHETRYDAGRLRGRRARADTVRGPLRSCRRAGRRFRRSSPGSRLRFLSGSTGG
ncbi:MAG: hypothetical protein HND48_13030 [Chloroflexi bacterium]|nr:hypothetical protein [Chloroflexota bacterium]